MNALLSLREVGKSFGATPLFTSITLNIGRGERIGLIGANGGGKSTLLRILAGVEQPDTGERSVQKSLRLAYLPQEDALPEGRTVEEVAASPLREQGVPETELYTRVGVMLGRAGFDDRGQQVAQLSGGWRKRLAIVCQLVREPDILLLDEPTNHLDLETILWLEELLLSLDCGYVVVSHDRYFLENITTRTIELGGCYPGGFFSADASYSTFLEKREEYRATLSTYEQSLANKVRREIEWLRRGPKARTTKAKFRKDEAGRLQDELAEVRRRNLDQGSAGIDFTATDRKTRRLLVAEGLAKAMGGKELFSDLDVVLSPGTRIGVVGLNGSGKTTLLRVLGGEILPDRGAVTRALGLQVVTFDQDRQQLDTAQSLRRALAPQGDSVIYRDRAIHVASWAKRFLFRIEQLPLPVSSLSGGEQARILIAQLMLRPADVLLLDEPSNNLDIQTLEVLEESLLDFPGAVVLITHDRYLMDRVSTVLLGLDGNGRAGFYADYAQWDAARLDAQRQEAKSRRESVKAVQPGKREGTGNAPKRPRKLSYHEQREWDAMEGMILEAEEALADATAAVEDPLVAADAAALQQRLEAQEQARAGVEALYARWEELEAKQAPQ